MRKRLDQKGFSLVEGLLVIIALALIVFVGYYVYHTQHSTDKTLNSASKVAQNTSPTYKQKAIRSNNQNYFTIKEWGIKAPYTGNSNLEYSIRNDVGTYAEFSSTQLDAVSASCKADGNGGGVIQRYLSTDTVYNDDGSDSNQTPDQYIANNPGISHSHVGDYYYFYLPEQGLCGANTSAVQTAVAQTSADVKLLVSEFVAL